MTRMLAFATLLCACALASPEPALAAKGGFKSGFKASFTPLPAGAFRPYRPVTPRPFSHTKFHGKPFHHHSHHKHHAKPLIIGLTGGGMALFSPAHLPGSPPEETPARPAIVPAGGTLGCAIEDIAISSGTVSIIRC